MSLHIGHFVEIVKLDLLFVHLRMAQLWWSANSVIPITMKSVRYKSSDTFFVILFNNDKCILGVVSAAATAKGAYTS